MIDALITGKLLRDPVLKTGPSGKPYCSFLLSVPTGDGEPVIVSGIAFADVAERIGKLAKGDAASVAGSLKPSEWTDKTTGELKHGLNVTVSAALTAYDIKKRRGNGESGSNSSAPPHRGTYDDRARSKPWR
ncbi:MULTISPECIES: single-stranded DNA-binding protein [Methylomicrobium]|uniref:Single-stranded DNA-binding protein n=1 Tax=Methylomicrobium album BG8 TaxID=686340 RepID=H8GLQ0_METAL|nr:MULTISPECIES: single-stranded DNA-binding protein [Methylomicrobium]EIC30577.1 single-stranded DNA-binding protein [Methylomicrobium album BG8]